MKKLLLSFVSSLVVLSASAQNFSARTFLNASSIYISNSVTFVTNLSSSVSIGTNISGVIATNLSGNAIQTNNVWNVNLLKTIDRFVDRNAGYITSAGATNACIFVNITSAGANATNGYTLEFVAVPDGTLEDTTTTAFTCVVAANTAVAGGWRYPIPGHLMAGVKSLRLRKVYSTVAPTATASNFTVDEVELCGFVP